jgi:hypothetical protein
MNKMSCGGQRLAATGDHLAFFVHVHEFDGSVAKFFSLSDNLQILVIGSIDD